MCDLFDDLGLSLAIVTETWIRTNENAENMKVDLKEGHKLTTILRNRDIHRPGSTVGGGVAIFYDDQKVSLKEFRLKKSNVEVVAALGRLPNVKRKIAIIAAYIPPSYSTTRKESAVQYIYDAIHKLRTQHNNPYIILGGDFNNTKLDRITYSFHDMEILESGPTHGFNTLDLIVTNIPNFATRTSAPLEDITGQKKSDHKTVIAGANVVGVGDFRKRKIKYVKYTPEGEQIFKDLLIKTDWVQTFAETPEDPTALVEKLTEVLEKYTEKSFRTMRRTIKTSDAPWMTREVEREIGRRKRMYTKAEDRTREWHDQKRLTRRLVKEAKKNYYEKTVAKLTEDGCHTLPYKAIKMLKTPDKPQRWDPRDMRPGLEDTEIVEEMAAHFNDISKEFMPLCDTDIPKTNKQRPVKYLEPYEVALKLKYCKKPKSTVKGDILPQLVTTLYDILAIPLCKIYNTVLYTNKWPRLWKTETVTVIPKSGQPQRWDDCRNLSCTPLFSKVLEGIVLERIREEVKIDEFQFGGAKGIGTEHLLIDAWDRILNSLDDNRGCVNLTSIDFSKAFNRMGHQACLGAFQKKGATEQTI